MINTEERNKMVENFSTIFNGDIENITVDDLVNMTNLINIAETTPSKEETKKPNLPEGYIDTWPRLKTSLEDFDNMIKTNRERIDNMRTLGFINNEIITKKPVVPEETVTEDTSDLNVTDLDTELMNEDYDNYEEELAKRLEAEMENKRKADVEKSVAESKAVTNTSFGYRGDSINNQKCAGYTLRCNGHCSICDKKCNGYISSESIVPLKMVDVAALCIMERKSPNVMYVSKTDIENLLSGKMAIVTPDGTAIVFNGRK